MNTEELELLSDSKYRQFINAIEKALKNFEYSSEWADLISALGKLNKVLQNHTKFKVLPRKLTIGKRLAQCMHPTLPSGVHLKALETYELIFMRIGRKGLAQDLFIYSAGLFPLLGNSAMSTRPLLMTMYENYFLPLGKALLPGLSGLLLGLLPGIEEGSEYTDRTISLLGSFSENTDKLIFYTTLWGCIYSSPSIRLPAITFILTRLSKKGVGKQEYLLGNDIPLLVQAVSVALGDSSVLVQRNMLDFVLAFLPVDTHFLSAKEKVMLVAAALEVLLRRDMSLNRRLYTWLLGPNSVKNESPSRTDSVCSSDADHEESMETFFSLHSRSFVIEAVRKVFQNQVSFEKGDSYGSKKAQRLEVLKPFRLLISLLDKPEIGGSILEDVLLDVFRGLYNHCKLLKENGASFEESDRRDSTESTHLETSIPDTSKTKLIDELIKTANLLFNAFEPYFMWEYIAKLLSDCDKPLPASEGVNGVNRDHFDPKPTTTNCAEMFRLTDFILDVVALDADVEIQTEHWPELLRRITIEMTKRCETMTLDDVKEGICLCSKLLSKVMPSDKHKSADKHKSGSSKDQRKDLEDSSEHELNEWNVIELNDDARDDSKGDKSLENSQEVFVEESVQNEGGEEEGVKVKETVASSKEKVDATTEERDGEDDSEDKFEDTQEDLDEWSDFQEVDHNLRTSEFESESSNELTTVDSKRGVKEKGEGHQSKSLGREGEEETKAQQPFQSSLIQACVKYFQNFFARFVVQRVLRHLNSLCPGGVNAGGVTGKECYTALRASGLISDSMWKEMDKEDNAASEKLVKDSCKTQASLKARRNVAGPTLLVSSFRSMQSSRNCAEAFVAACKLLLELSCFPVCSGRDSESEKISTDKNEVSKVAILPEWLQSLIMCCFEITDFDIQSSAVGTLLDLINLTLSVTTGHSNGSRSSAPVVVIPMISQQSLGFIEKSDLYEVIAESLWDHIEEDTTQFHQRIVQLFLQLHNLTPFPSLCANVIGNSLVDTNKEVSLQGHWKFAVFWHVARNVVIQDSGRSSRLGEFRTLDRALFIMLDSLENDEPEIRVLTQHWLAHALQHGDLGRIIDPLLLLLLHPVTARVSIHYLYALVDTKIFTKLSTAQGTDKMSNDVKVYSSAKENGNSMAGRQRNKAVKRKTEYSSRDTRESDGSKTASPSGPSEVEHSTDTDGAEADDENEENEPKIGKENDTPPNKAPQSPPPKRSLVHPLDQHKLLYILHYDSQLTLYAFSTLQTILSRAPHQFVCASSATSVSSSSTPHQEKIKELLIRHRRSLLGKGFYGALYDSPVSPSGPAHSARLFGGPLIYLKPSTSKYLEVLLSVSLYFIRSEYSSHLQVQPEDIDGNVQVQMASTEFLLGIMWQLVEVVKESGAGFGTYISDMFSRCKVQKALLHCLLSTLYERTGVRGSASTLSPSLKPSHIHVSSEISQSQARAFQVKLLKLIQSVLILESNIRTAVAISQDNPGGHGTPPPSKPESPKKVTDEVKVTQSSHRYIPGKSLAEQGMLLSAVLHGLRHDERDVHYEWLQFVVTCLSHMGAELRTWVVPVAEHLCRILEKLTTVYSKDRDVKVARKDTSEELGIRQTEAESSSVPPDYVVTLLESLQSICHYCLRDKTAPMSPVLSLKPRISRSSSSPSVNTEGIQSSGSSVQILTNLLHAFSVQSAPACDVPSVEVPKHILDAREGLLSVLPKILSSLFSVWSTWSPQRADSTGQRLPSEWPLNLMGSPKAVRQQILQLLTPVTMNHTIVFLASLADVWYQRRRREGSGSKTTRGIPVASEDQIIVVDIVYAIKALSVEDMIENVKQIVRQVVTSKDKTTPTQSGLEVNILQFLFEYLKKASESQLIHVRSSLLSLMKEGLQLNFPPALFLLLVILRSYVQNIPLQEDKKVRKELQDITQRLVEACNSVAGSSLENAAWFRRTLAVIPQPEVASDLSSNVESEVSEVSEAEPPVTPPTVLSGSATSYTSSYSTQALYVLAEVLAPVLDMVFGSDEKERMTSFLTTVMYNVTPFLKNHSPHNVPSFRACCNLLASLSGYQYTRRAWKKDVMELLLDPNFFQMDISCIGSWRTIIDNLMTQDNTSFKELMARVAGLSQSASINIFANREQEMEQRAQHLKKLSFTIFCSEVDQYQYCLPEIQERLAESLRLPQSPVVHEQIFLFFRVLILRMSAQHLTPLWPTIFSEVVHVLLQMESDLSSDGKPHKHRMLISELLLGSNGYINYSQEKWLGLYLAVCKLLDLSQALPSDYLSQFQLYRWAFEGEAYNMTAGEEKVPVFKPHIARLEKLLRKKRRDKSDIEELQRVSGQPLLTMYQIKSLDQLLPFFQCLCRCRFANCAESQDKNSRSKSAQGRSLLERVVERDFLEPLVVD